MNKKILIYGFGRMGLTHYAILNQLIDNVDFVFVDPDKRVNYFAQRNLDIKIVCNDKYLNQSFDYALICTPPISHISLLNNCIKNNISSIFVEKPFGGINDNFSIKYEFYKNISIGYVLRFNPIIQWVKDNIDVQNIERVEGYYFSNTIEKKPSGWRNSIYSGVTNEVGSHIIDLCVYLFGLSTPSLIDKSINPIISDVDDILIANLVDRSIQYHFHFDWVNKEYRKPVFKFLVTMKDGSKIKFDQQKIEYSFNNNIINRVSIVDIAQNIPYYLRGVDFTSQMQDFIGSKKAIATFDEAMITRNLINKLIS